MAEDNPAAEAATEVDAIPGQDEEAAAGESEAPAEPPQGFVVPVDAAVDVEAYDNFAVVGDTKCDAAVTLVAAWLT